MPSVRYDKSMYAVGWRPQGTNPFAAAHGMGGVFTRRGGETLHGLGDAGTELYSAIAFPGSPSGCSTWNLFSPSAACSLPTDISQVQSVPQNAINANAAAVAAGLPPPYDIDQIQAAADAGSAALAKEVPELFKPSISDPSTWPWYAWAGIGFVGLKVLKVI